MKLPWVSREAFDILQYNKDAAAQNAESFHNYINDLLNKSEARYADLLAKYQVLKIMGATSPDNNPPPPKPEKDIVSEAIIVRSGNNVHLRRHYAEYVTFQRAAGIADVEIAAGILEGEVEDGGIP